MEKEKKLEQSIQKIDKIYSKIEILLEIINRQIEQKISMNSQKYLNNI